MLTKAQMATAEKMLSDYLLRHYGKEVSSASSRQLYDALAFVAKELLFERKGKVNAKEANKNKKTIHYMSIEFLIGKNLKNHLWNLELEKFYSKLLSDAGKNIEDVYAVEKDAGLGNGGLGRLAACFLDSCAKLGYPAFGHSIKYEYGLFNQKIVDGKQIETPDEWLDTGNVWLEPREDESVEVVFNGNLKQNWQDGKMVYDLENPTVVHAVPYDMMVSGFGSNTVSTLRLWEAKARKMFDIKNLIKVNLLKHLLKRTKLKQSTKFCIHQITMKKVQTSESFNNISLFHLQCKAF